MLHFFLGVLAGLIIGWIVEWAMDWSVLRPFPKRPAADPNFVYTREPTAQSNESPQEIDGQHLSPTASDDTTHIAAAEDD